MGMFSFSKLVPAPAETEVREKMSSRRARAPREEYAAKKNVMV